MVGRDLDQAQHHFKDPVKQIAKRPASGGPLRFQALFFRTDSCIVPRGGNPFPREATCKFHEHDPLARYGLDHRLLSRSRNINTVNEETAETDESETMGSPFSYQKELTPRNSSGWSFCRTSWPRPWPWPRAIPRTSRRRASATSRTSWRRSPASRCTPASRT